MISHNQAPVWCFLFVTLFNLQGTRHLGGTFAILARSFLFVKHFFEIFFISFSALFFRLTHYAIWLCYLTTSSRFCQEVFSGVFRFPFFPLHQPAAVSDSFVRLPRLLLFVNPFFSFFRYFLFLTILPHFHPPYYRHFLNSVCANLPLYAILFFKVPIFIYEYEYVGSVYYESAKELIFCSYAA